MCLLSFRLSPICSVRILKFLNQNFDRAVNHIPMRKFYRNKGMSRFYLKKSNFQIQSKNPYNTIFQPRDGVKEKGEKFETAYQKASECLYAVHERTEGESRFRVYAERIRRHQPDSWAKSKKKIFFDFPGVSDIFT